MQNDTVINDNNSNLANYHDPKEMIKWCRYLVNISHVTAAGIILAHVIWYFAARSALVRPPDVYLRYFIIFPAIGLFAINLLVDLSIRSTRLPLLAKECLSLSLFVIYSFYLSLTHEIAIVLLCAFILPIFASALFSDVRITRWVFALSLITILLFGVKMHFIGKFDSFMIMQIFVVTLMFFGSYLLSNILIKYGHHNLSVLMNSADLQRHMQEQLLLDPFTGLYNKKTFDDNLSKFVEACQCAEEHISLALIDLDNFKQVNDRYGHAAGDRVLLHLSQILKDIQSDNIRAFRVGGEEFALVFKDCDCAEALKICEHIQTQVKFTSLRSTDDHEVTISCGLVCAESKNTNAEALTKAADAALYEAKRNGRDQTVIFDDSLAA
jgi:diguanylate cyclase (GGDEF)-like protein